MSRKRTTIQWQVCEDEREWQNAQTFHVESSSEQKAPPRTVRWALPSLLFLLVLGAVVGGWIRHRAQVGLDNVATELHDAVVTELWTLHPITSSALAGPDRSLSPGVRHEPAEPQALRRARGAEVAEVVTAVEIRALGDDWALMDVLLQGSTAGSSYRQTRFYQEGALGWQRAEVKAEHWGQERRLESSYFIFHYRALDHEAVTQAAPQLDALYSTLFGAFFSGTPPAEKVVIRVDPEWEPGEVPPQNGPPGAAVVASPAATLVPTDLVLSDHLIQSVMLVAFDTLAERATTHYNLPSKWLPLRDGMELWLTWQQELPLAIWREPLVKWVFRDKESDVRQRASALPDFAKELCDHHLLWIRKPLFDLGVPMTCPLQPAGEKQSVAWRYHKPLPEIPLPPLVDTPMYLQAPDKWWVSMPAEGVALATLLEYATAAFGAERLPKLLALLAQHERWETLIPAVFGLSLKEFESGWRAFLEERYGITGH